MEDIVSIKIRDSDGTWYGLMTYGRIWARNDDRDLLRVVSQHLATFGIREPQSLELCDSLQQVSTAQYFYEALLSFASDPIPFGDKYDQWRVEKRRALEQGNGLYFLGRLTEAEEN